MHGKKKKKIRDVFYFPEESEQEKKKKKGKNTNHIFGYRKEKHENGRYRNKEKVKTSRAFVPKRDIDLTEFTTDLNVKALLT